MRLREDMSQTDRVSWKRSLHVNEICIGKFLAIEMLGAGNMLFISFLSLLIR